MAAVVVAAVATAAVSAAVVAMMTGMATAMAVALTAMMATTKITIMTTKWRAVHLHLIHRPTTTLRRRSCQLLGGMLSMVARGKEDGSGGGEPCCQWLRPVKA